MATVYTNVGANQVDGANFPGGGLTTQPGTYNDVLLENANLTFVTATYTMTGSEAANDVINVVKLCEGQIVVTQLSFVTTNAAATTITVDVGDTDPAGTVANRYAAGLNVATSGSNVVFAGGASAGNITPFLVTGDCWLTGKLATLATPSAGKVIVFRVAIAQIN